MDPAIERDLIERARRAVSGEGADEAATEVQVPVAEYLDPSHFAAERNELFGRAPIAIAPLSQIQGPGDFVTIDHYGLPLLATRDAAGQSHVFLNACQHRGTRLVSEPSGRSSTSFVCPYHAWAYGTDGQLRGINRSSAFPLSMAERPRLAELPSTESAGFLWTSLDHGGSVQNVASTLGPLDGELDALMKRYPVAYAPHSQTWKGNWKIFVEGGLETYHFKIAHRETISPYFHDDITVRDHIGPHQRMVLPRRSFAKLDASATSGLRAHANLVYFLFPNLTILAQADHLVLIEIYPTAIDESRITVTMMLDAEPAGATEAHWRKNRDITLHVLQQDFELGAQVQAGLASGALTAVRLGKNEIGVADFHRDVVAQIRTRSTS